MDLKARHRPHPDLLDWLALELIRNDWNVQAIQRQILLSQTYQQSSQFRDELRERDPKNHLYARGPRSRLPAFTLRDQALSVSGLLVEKLGGRLHQNPTCRPKSGNPFPTTTTSRIRVETFIVEAFTLIGVEQFHLPP